MAKVTRGPATQVVFVCPSCSAKTSIHANLAGKVRCSGCGTITRR